LLLVFLCVSASLEVSFAWVASKPSNTRKVATTPKIKTLTLQPSQLLHTSSSSSKTAKFYQTSSPGLAEEAAMAMAKAVSSETFATQTTGSQSQPDSLSTIRNLPWMKEDGPDSEACDNVFFAHWNWQFSYFEDHLTNLKVRDVKDLDESVQELFYATKDSTNTKSNKPQQRVYTISLESDEYRDIRMTYMHCPGMQTFRCLSYPRNGDIPIMGMGLMKMGGVKNLAILDYQPLPPTGDQGFTINDTYTSELLKLRAETPSMSQTMSARHFDTNDERKYFTEFPLLGRCNELEASDGDVEDYRRDLLATQKKYVAKHTELTQMFDKDSQSNSKSNPNTEQDVLERHSDFDTHVSEREPAGPFLCGVFGPETGGKLVHNVIFPLSNHGLNGQGVPLSVTN